MNPYLETIKKLIEENGQLSGAEREALIKSVVTADKQWGITDFKLDRTEKVKRTTAILLEETIAELEQKRIAVEKQNRELEIESALERARSRTMGMQKSDELREIIQVVFDQFVQLGFNTEHTGFIMDYKARTDMSIWLADKHYVPAKITIPYFDSPHWNSFIEAKEKGKDFFANFLDFETKNKFYKDLFELIPGLPDEAREYYFNRPGVAISTVLLDNVGLYIENFTPVPYTDEENATLMRFGKVFQQAYTRFLDLQKAEAQAREAQIETALEKVRSRTLAMHKSDELAETAAEVFRQLKGLGIELNRLYIGIVRGEDGDIEMWATDEKGEHISQKFTFNKNGNASVYKLFEGWKAKLKSMVVDMKGEELSEYLHYLKNILKLPVTGGADQQRRLQSVAYFSQGFIGMASTEEISSDSIFLLERFAAVFNLTFARFNDLKISEAHAVQAEQDLIEIKAARKKAEEALTELTLTQNQLIQKEKMASLGELTAGIAHEIQNPLNFVNNFSEVSGELLEEAEGSRQEAGENSPAVTGLLKDIKENLTKINHHGKRADAIVKGMLQHSRTTTGVKEPTDLNALVDEYLKLAFHGYRGKDNSFEATIETYFDPAVGVLEISPGEMGRVLLNVLANAFYACAERIRNERGESDSVVNHRDAMHGVSTMNDAKYLPIISVTTKRTASNIEITVTDNGIGIDPKIIDKIFQPFFTTKPTGQGTGLGLSLAYDIVKAHGGNLTARSHGSSSTTFIIQISA